MYIIKVSANECGARPPIQSWDEASAPEGYAACSESVIPIFTSAKGFVNIVVENDVVISMAENTEAKKAWEALPQPIPQLTPEQDRDAMLADLSYRTTLLETGVI